jgi:SPX domain protein involved in polyphosphate accumulation
MKFGTQLQSQRASQWRYHYVDYDGLKELLKTKSHEREFTAQDEDEFVKHLNAELEKVCTNICLVDHPLAPLGEGFFPGLGL